MFAERTPPAEQSPEDSTRSVAKPPIGDGHPSGPLIGRVLLLSLFGMLPPSLALDYPIVDTGQERCFNDKREIPYPKAGERFFGQDAQYRGNSPTYRDNHDGTISDLVTGLMWQKDPGDKLSFEEAVAGAAACRTGGYSDWRLPSIKELYSLIQFSGEDVDPQSPVRSNLRPFIDTNYFNFAYGDPAKGERIIDSQMATSTRYVSTTMRGNPTMFGVNFADGRIKGYPIGSGRRGGPEKTYYVLYVRGNPKYGINAFHDNGDGTITDHATGLTWLKQDSGFFKVGEKKDGRLNWEQALRWAEGLEFAGHSDWRLPNIKELQSLVDYTRSPDTTHSAAIDPLFDVTPIRNASGQTDYAFYWSSTTHKRMGRGDAAAYIAFGRSQGWMRDFSGQYDLLDVHGAGSQRSDPKSGDPSQFPRGRGPQGDVIAIYNMVRPVRGGKAVFQPTGPELEPRRESPGRPGVSEGMPPNSMRLRRPGDARGAQLNARPGGRPSPPFGFPPPDFVQRLDRNHDGRVSRKEFDGPADAFERLDADHNGYLDDSESPLRSRTRQPPNAALQTPPRTGAERSQQGRSNRGSRFLQRFDANQDGRVARSEFDGPARRFQQLDRDGNGVLSGPELDNVTRPGTTAGKSLPLMKAESSLVTSTASVESVQKVIETPIHASTRWKQLPPSFVFILVDDMGWTGLSCPMDDRVKNSKSDYYQTPQIDSLARSGVRFAHAYAPSSMCTPSRAGILTGLSPAQLHMTTPGPSRGQPSDRKLIPPRHVDSLPDSVVTIAEVLHDHGYATAHFGKWHLSGGGPGRHGFDRHDGETGNGGAGLCEAPNPKDIFGVTQRAIAFMQDQVRNDRPFYVQLSHYAVHEPTKACETSIKMYANKTSGKRHHDPEFAAMTADLDTSVGLLLQSIERLGIADNTYVIFMSDNGPANPPARANENLPLAGGKATFWEGGIRVPLIIRGPNVARNTFCHETVVGFDLLPTLCELARIPKAEQPVSEGTSLVSLLSTNEDASRFHRDPDRLVFHFPHYGRGPKQVPQSAIIAGDIKLIRFYETNEIRLFDLSHDLGEQRDLRDERPDLATSLTKALDAYLARIDAQMPSPNPDYDANSVNRPNRRQARLRDSGSQSNPGSR